MFTPLNKLSSDIQIPRLLWQVDGVLAYDAETQCRLGYSRNSKGSTLKCWIDAPVMHLRIKVCSFKINERTLTAAIAKADQIFQKKYPKFAKEREEYLRKKEAGEIKDETPLTMWTPAGYVLNGVPVRKIKAK